MIGLTERSLAEGGRESEEEREGDGVSESARRERGEEEEEKEEELEGMHCADVVVLDLAILAIHG